MGSNSFPKATVNILIVHLLSLVWRRMLSPAPPHLVILQSGTGHALLCLHLVLRKMGGGQRQQVVSSSTGWLLARSVPVGCDGGEGRGLLQRRRCGKHALEVCYRWEERERGWETLQEVNNTFIKMKKILTWRVRYCHSAFFSHRTIFYGCWYLSGLMVGVNGLQMTGSLEKQIH